METPETGQPAWRKKLRLALTAIAAACAIVMVLFVGQGQQEEPITIYYTQVNDTDCMLKGYLLDTPPAGYTWIVEPSGEARYLVGKTALEPAYVSNGLADSLLLHLNDQLTIDTPYGQREAIIVAVYAEDENSLIMSATVLDEWFTEIE